MPLAASLAEKVREGVYLLSVDWDLRFSKAYAMKTAAKEALLAEKKEEKDYQVLDELPFYFNGAGYVNKHRTALFLLGGGERQAHPPHQGELRRVLRSPEPDGTQLLFTGESYTTKRKLRSGVYRYDFATGETAQLLAPRTYSLYDALWWGEKVLLLATDHKRYGINENAQFYTLEPATGEISLLAPYEEAVEPLGGQRLPLGRRPGVGGPGWEALLCGHHPQRLPGVLPGGKRGHPAGVHPGGLRGLHRRGRRHAVLHRHAGPEAPGASTPGTRPPRSASS